MEFKLCDGVNAENGESLQVIHYEVGQKFDPHFDGLGRIATFLMYLYVKTIHIQPLYIYNNLYVS